MACVKKNGYIHTQKTNMKYVGLDWGAHFINFPNDTTFFFQAEDGIRDVERSRGLGDVYKRQVVY